MKKLKNQKGISLQKLIIIIAAIIVGIIIIVAIFKPKEKYSSQKELEKELDRAIQEAEELNNYFK